MNLLYLPWEIILIILKQYNDYKYCIRLLMTCKQLYDNDILVKEIKSYFINYKVDLYGKQCWYFNGKCHREDDKPAVIHPDGRQEWYLNGKLHRNYDKPAFIDSDKYQSWYLNGKRHRENGPAKIWPCGTKEWYLNGKYYIEKEYWIEMNKINSLKN